MEDEENLLPVDYEETDVDSENVTGDRSFKINKSVKAWYLIKRRRQREEEEA